MEFVICQNTQCPEKYICLNAECYQVEKKQIQCYQCLTKYHLSKNKVVKHVDDFIELEQFINEIKKKQIRRNTFIQMIIQQALDFSKNKIQEVQLSRNADLIKNATEKIEGETIKLLKFLTSTYLEQKFTFPYQNSFHVFYVKFFFEDENKYQEDSKSQLTTLFSQIEKYMQSLDLDIRTTIKRSQQKLEVLEKQVTQFSKQSLYNKFLLLLLILLFPYLFYLQSNQFEILSFERQQGLTTQRQDQLQQDVLNLKDNFNLLEQQHQYLLINQTGDIQALNQTVTQVIDSIQKLKLRFDTFKQSYTLNLEKDKNNFQSQVEAIQNNLTQFLNSEFDLRSKIQEISSMLQLQNFKKEQIKSVSAQQIQVKKEQKKKLKKIIDYIEEENVMRKIIQLKNYVYTLLNFRHLIKIHLHLPKNNLKGFELIYDELFNKPILLQTMASIQQMVFKHDRDNPLLCLGGLSIMSLEIIDLIACDFANDMFRPTFDSQKAIKSTHGNIYWYQVQEQSFGFAPNESINLLLCDDQDEKSEYRLSYWYNIKTLSGGRRLGMNLSLENSIEYRLQIYLLNPPFQ
ncbi:unnamed protein product (macronuclear) [Paramecium tetraurelia]|uniref:SUN domain-containing protein n=1 Tax=Paramecium tetraurelia TaxID=5888 RepID=A0BU94_PARTE|nr:uncharacterized protein GSPATT00032343001 [Paramecium tetraurelia]CAK62111.1 unnamed protein product [Paramecium tetraurelia]|eukprot:XP_001429509.1 hypothetical protein (macronuclear) [Paramecium tetraurelia strain d4-2]